MGRFLPLVLVLMFPAFAAAQNLTIVPPPDVRDSPVRISSANIGDKYIKVVYGSPVSMEAEIFGNTVPFGEVWSTGANEATEITLTAGTMIAGEHIDAGTYSLYTIPGPSLWTIIFNSRLGQAGSDPYDESLDVLRVKVPARKTTRQVQAFTIDMEAGEHAAGLILRWGRTEVIVPIMVH